MKKNKLQKKLITLWLALILALPTVIQFNHIFEEHATISSAKIGINIAIKYIDCSVYHHLFQVNSTLNFDKHDYLTIHFWSNKIINFKHLYSHKQLFTLLTRGPPSFQIT